MQWCESNRTHRNAHLASVQSGPCTGISRPGGNTTAIFVFRILELLPLKIELNVPGVGMHGRIKTDSGTPRAGVAASKLVRFKGGSTQMRLKTGTCCAALASCSYTVPSIFGVNDRAPQVLPGIHVEAWQCGQVGRTANCLLQTSLLPLTWPFTWQQF